MPEGPADIPPDLHFPFACNLELLRGLALQKGFAGRCCALDSVVYLPAEPTEWTESRPFARYEDAATKVCILCLALAIGVTKVVRALVLPCPRARGITAMWKNGLVTRIDESPAISIAHVLFPDTFGQIGSVSEISHTPAEGTS